MNKLWRGRGSGRMEKDREESCYRMGGVGNKEGERDGTHVRDSRETKLNVPFSILVRSRGTGLEEQVL